MCPKQAILTLCLVGALLGAATATPPGKAAPKVPAQAKTKGSAAHPQKAPLPPAPSVQAAKQSLSGQGKPAATALALQRLQKRLMQAGWNPAQSKLAAAQGPEVSKKLAHNGRPPHGKEPAAPAAGPAVKSPAATSAPAAKAPKKTKKATAAPKAKAATKAKIGKKKPKTENKKKKQKKETKKKKAKTMKKKKKKKKKKKEKGKKKKKTPTPLDAKGKAPAKTKAKTAAAKSHSPHDAGQPLHFLSLGDWGCSTHGRNNAVSVARVMQSWASKNSPRFVLTLGDNFYDGGVKKASDPKFKRIFESVFLRFPSLHVPWLVTLGNHDYLGNVEAQRDYHKVNPLWQVPNQGKVFYWAQTHKIGKFVMHVIVLDTQQMVKHSHGDKRQLKWLYAQLSNTTAHVRIVAGHHPVYSAGYHGNTEHLVKHVAPLLKQFRVNAYLSGHDHSLQLITQDGTDFFVNGAGCKLSAPIHRSKSNLKKYVPAHGATPKLVFGLGQSCGFMGHTIDPVHRFFTTSVFNMDGKQVYSVQRKW